MNKGYTFVLVVLTLVFALIPSVHAEAKPAEFALSGLIITGPHGGLCHRVTDHCPCAAREGHALGLLLTPLTSRSTVVLPSKSPMLVTSKLMVTTATDFSIHASPISP
jgi:hypothetical protein